MKFRIALRNVARNRRRTLVNVLMIASGIGAMVVFAGFSSYIVSCLQYIAINTQYGHLQIASPKTWNLSAKDKPRDRLIEFPEELKSKITAQRGVAYASGRISFFALINDHDQSVSARAVAINPEIEKQMIANTPINAGRKLNEDGKFEIVVGKGLVAQMGLKIGQSLTLMAQTFDGSVNAIDCEMVGIIETGITDVDDTTFFIPLKTAQRLLDTEKVERILVQLEDGADVDSTASAFKAILPEGLEPKTWVELAAYYRQVVDYFNVQNKVIQWILMILAFLAVGNIVGTSIAERTGEIGTVRALGGARSAVINQFLFEGLLLGILGGVVGCLLGLIAAQGLTALEIPIMAPGSSHPFPMKVELLPIAFVKGFIAMSFMAVIATMMPALRASRVEIVEALKRNI